MRIALVAMAAASTLVLTSCKVLPTAAEGNTNLVCAAAKAWISADPGVKSHLSDELSSAIKDMEKTATSAEHNGAAPSVIAAAKDLLQGKGDKVTQAAQTIQKYC